MKYLLVSILALILTGPAYAGTVAITVTGSGLSYTSTLTVPDASLIKLVAFYRASIGQVSNGAGGLRQLTPIESVDAWWKSVIAVTANNLQAADAQVVPVVPFGQ